MSVDVGFVVLAAGKGTRMHSDRPKVLQEVLGKPLLAYVLDALKLTRSPYIWTVIGHGAEDVRAICASEVTKCVLQEQQLGTGHAVQQVWPEILASGVDYVCVVNGDTPCVPLDHVSGLIERCRAENAAMGFVSLVLANPAGYGRVIRNDDNLVTGITEQKDFDPVAHGGEIFEVNSGIYVFNVSQCSTLLGHLNQNNAQGEFYLTQMIELCCSAGFTVAAEVHSGESLLLGINSPRELVSYEQALGASIVSAMIDKGVIIRNGEQVTIGPDVIIEPGVEITGPCAIYGRSVLRRGARIEAYCHIDNAVLDACQVKSFSHIELAEVAAGASIGPYARLRPGSQIGPAARVGNFVEIKKSVLHDGAKASHLTYIGDSDIGAGVNIGAGTITCNYDGTSKHRTMIGDGAFIGSNTALVAPVTVGCRALVGAGSVVTKDVPDGMLCVARGRQVNIPLKKKPSSGSSAE